MLPLLTPWTRPLSTRIGRLGLLLAERGQLPDSDLGWFGAVAVGEQPFHVIPKLVALMTLAAYAGSIAFFFRARKANLSKHIGPVEPGDADNDA